MHSVLTPWVSSSSANISKQSFRKTYFLLLFSWNSVMASWVQSSHMISFLISFSANSISVGHWPPNRTSSQTYSNLMLFNLRSPLVSVFWKLDFHWFLGRPMGFRDERWSDSTFRQRIASRGPLSGKLDFHWFPGRPMGFRDERWSDSTFRQRIASGGPLSGKLDFHWFPGRPMGFRDERCSN